MATGPGFHYIDGMERVHKLKLQAMAAIGQREEAVAWIRDTYRVNGEEAERLMQAAEAESPVRGLPQINRTKLIRWAGLGIFLLGMLQVAIGLSRYFAYEMHDERQLSVTSCTVQSVKELPGGMQEVTFVYTYEGRTYTNTERSSLFREVDIREGAVLELWVNAERPEEALLTVLKPLVQAAGVRYMVMGVILLILSIVGWRILKSRL